MSMYFHQSYIVHASCYRFCSKCRGLVRHLAFSLCHLFATESVEKEINKTKTMKGAAFKATCSQKVLPRGEVCFVLSLNVVPI